LTREDIRKQLNYEVTQCSCKRCIKKREIIEKLEDKIIEMDKQAIKEI
jgi:hypothetical protein